MTWKLSVFSYVYWLFPFFCELPVLSFALFSIGLFIFVFLIDSSFLYILNIKCINIFLYVSDVFSCSIVKGGDVA